MPVRCQRKSRAPTTARDRAKLIAIAIGCVAISLAVGSWIHQEGIALGVLAIFLGVAAIAWEQALFVFLAFVFVGGPAVWFDWLRWERCTKQETKSWQ